MDESISRAAKDLVQKMIADVFQSSLAETRIRLETLGGSDHYRAGAAFGSGV